MLNIARCGNQRTVHTNITGADAEDIDEANADNGYPEVVEHNESGSVYDLKTDFIVLLPDEIITSKYKRTPFALS